MPIAIKPDNLIVDKFVRRAQAAGPELETGLRNPRNPQSASAIAAASRWQASVSSPAALDRFKAKLAAAGESKWQNNAIEKAVKQGRYAQGVGIAGPAYAAGEGPILAALRNLTLPDKGLKRSPQNLERVRVVTQAVAAAAGRA